VCWAARLEAFVGVVDSDLVTPKTATQGEADSLGVVRQPPVADSATERPPEDRPPRDLGSDGRDQLSVTVTDDAIHIRWFPFAWRTVRLTDIESAQARTYRPLLEYGGWGVRWSPGRGMAWNASGNRGVQLTLTSGKQLLIGSQRADELAKVIREGAKIAGE